MPISFAEQHTLACPRCGSDVEAELWLIVDVDEHPELIQALRDGTLNRIACPQCSYTAPADAPLLLHDRPRQRVLFATPPDAVEDADWRHLAREIHSVLVGSIPIEERRAYLGEVQVEQGVDGLRRALGPPPDAPVPAPVPAAMSAALDLPEQSPGDESPLLAAVQALLAAGTPDEFRAVVASHPLLLQPEIDTALAQLAEMAAEERQHEVAEALMQARFLLADLRRTVDQVPEAVAPGDVALIEAIQALLVAQTEPEIAATIQRYPQLRTPPAQEGLWAFAAAARAQGDEELAVFALELRARLRAPADT